MYIRFVDIYSIVTSRVSTRDKRVPPEIRELQRSIETYDLRYFPQHVLLWGYNSFWGGGYNRLWEGDIIACGEGDIIACGERDIIACGEGI